MTEYLSNSEHKSEPFSPGGLVYLDDILVYSNNAEEHEAHLQRVFDRLHEHKL